MSKATISVNDANFSELVLNSDSPVLVDFWAPWCGPCVAIGPTLDALAEEYQGRVKVVKMNIDENANTPAEFGVRSIPFLVMIKKGQVIDTAVGSQPKAKLKDMIEKSLV